jgi:hypothetical protein
MSEAIERRGTGERLATDGGRATTAAYVVEASEATLVVTDGHLRVQHTGSQRVRDLTAADIRRIQVDVEVGRPATVAIVPNSGAEAELLTVQRDQFRALFAAIQHLAIELDNVCRS